MNTQKELIERAETNLERQLAWIGRYDTRVAFIAGIAIVMLGFLATTTGTLAIWTPWIKWSFVIGAGLLLSSLVCIYCGQYPKTESLNTSLLYFGTIADMKLDEFERKFKDGSSETYLDDLLAQTHRNAIVLQARAALSSQTASTTRKGMIGVDKAKPFYGWTIGAG
jgi:hypothetical protein